MKGRKKQNPSENSASRSIYASIALLAVAVVVMMGAFFLNDQQFILNKTHIANAGELRVLSQQIATSSIEAAAGKEEAFPQLKSASDQFGMYLNSMTNAKLSATPFSENSSHPANLQIESLNAAWVELQTEVNMILAAESIILSLHDVAATLSETVPQLQIEYDEVLEILLEADAPAEQIAMAQRQPWLAERILRNSSKVLVGGEDSIMAADGFGRDAKLFGRVLTGMLEGNAAMRIERIADDDAIDRLTEIADIFAFVDDQVDDILETSPELFQVRSASDIISTDAQQLLQQTSILTNTFESFDQQRQILELSALISAIVAVLSLISIGLSILKVTRQRLEHTKAQNKANQNAIMRLLDEMEDLADGDLTVNASVTEDFTGAIADSINFSIEQLRSLVNTINQTAVQVDTAAQETQATAKVLARSAEDQANDINITTKTINEIAETINEVSINASNSAEVAERSVQIATNGGQVVRNTIEGMSTIREQIQDTSKRIKRLGESSQEVGDIISLINDIADQTNILSLNAAIQASMAGEAGRGFAVVADEVQRLAERVSAATRQVEGLISTIQADTSAAVKSMEQTTTEVVHGTRLAKDAGVALEEIEEVSNDLASLIRYISETTRTQATATSNISTRMTTIREITSQTSAGTTTTAQSVGDLALMANEMRQSVAGFKLPETES
ncbi:chemotaxis protein [Endozoicomonas sp. (ex Bugula neritina AB1)]|nr:chemotaxis protein [Endozoicomonas sp. (ex Bugula neritina AB1)]